MLPRRQKFSSTFYVGRDVADATDRGRSLSPSAPIDTPVTVDSGGGQPRTRSAPPTRGRGQPVAPTRIVDRWWGDARVPGSFPMEEDPDIAAAGVDVRRVASPKRGSCRVAVVFPQDWEAKSRRVLSILQEKDRVIASLRRCPGGSESEHEKDGALQRLREGLGAKDAHILSLQKQVESISDGVRGCTQSNSGWVRLLLFKHRSTNQGSSRPVRVWSARLALCT